MCSSKMLAATIAACMLFLTEVSHAKSEEVDVELILAVDISYSMDPDELALQRRGYIDALMSAEVTNAIRDGIHGRIAATYVEWAGSDTQNVIVGWRLIDGRDAASAFAAEIGEAPMRRAFRTSISSALLFSAAHFEESGFKGIRRVIDISGDGANNQGPLLSRARDQVLARGIVINGLPLVFKAGRYGTLDIVNLADYYEHCVIGGPGAFLVPVMAPEQFIEAIRTKLVLEISGLTPARTLPMILPASNRGGGVVDCSIGERLWRQRYGN